MHFYALDCYEKAIREPQDNHDRAMIKCYLNLCLQAARNCHTISCAHHVYARMIRTFEEIICDDLLTKQWRMLCYKTFKQVLPLLFEVMDYDDYAQVYTRFSELNDYFLGSEKVNACAKTKQSGSK